MLPHIRAIVAASAYAVITGRKVAGLYDHVADRHLRIAAECRGDWLQARDGERSVDFGGTLPDLYDQGDKAFVSLERDGATVRGYDRGSATFYDARAAGDVVQIYDHGTNGWFAFTVQVV